jgi:hypothetical protein
MIFLDIRCSLKPLAIAANGRLPRCRSSEETTTAAGFSKCKPYGNRSSDGAGLEYQSTSAEIGIQCSAETSKGLSLLEVEYFSRQQQPCLGGSESQRNG